MIPNKTIEELISRHSTLEKDLSSGTIDKKLFAEKSKEYSDVNEIIESVIGVFIWDSFSSNILTVSITWKACLAHEGQDIILTPLFLRFKDFRISFPIVTSFVGLSDKEILIVSPIPSIKRLPRPMEDLILPDTKLPASVMPKWRG